MKILLPIAITEAMMKEGTNVPSVDADAGEVAWVASGIYAADDLRVYNGGVYKCAKGYTADANSPTPDKDATRWKFKEPSNRMSPFDEYIYTAAKKAGELKYDLELPFFTGFAMYGAEADVIDVRLKNSDGVDLVEAQSAEMWEQAFGEYEYLFGNLQQTKKLTRQGLPLSPASRLQISLKRNNPTVNAELGFLAVGQWQQLLFPRSTIGGTDSADVTPKSYAYYESNSDGTYKRIAGRVAKLISASVLIDASEAPRVERLLEKIIDIPVAIEASSLPRYGHLSTVGFVSGSVRTTSDWQTARVDIKVTGNI